MTLIVLSRCANVQNMAACRDFVTGTLIKWAHAFEDSVGQSSDLVHPERDVPEPECHTMEVESDEDDIKGFLMTQLQIALLSEQTRAQTAHVGSDTNEEELEILTRPHEYPMDESLELVNRRSAAKE